MDFIIIIIIRTVVYVFLQARRSTCWSYDSIKTRRKFQMGDPGNLTTKKVSEQQHCAVMYSAVLVRQLETIQTIEMLTWLSKSKVL